MIVDDEPLAVRLLESMVGRMSDLELCGSFTDSIAALDALQQQPVDLLFLDIQMPDLNGMELAQTIDNRKTRIIFTTAFKDFAFESYEVNALDFLLKPIRYVKFQAAIDKAREYFALKKCETQVCNNDAASTSAAGSNPSEPATVSDTPSQTSIFLRIEGELRQVQLDQLLYVEGMKDYLKFFIEGERSPWITHMTMSAAEKLLPTTQFMRIHRSYIISLNHIRSIDRNDCVYIGDQIIRVTEAYKDTFARFVGNRS